MTNCKSKKGCLQLRGCCVGTTSLLFSIFFSKLVSNVCRECCVSEADTQPPSSLALRSGKNFILFFSILNLKSDHNILCCNIERINLQIHRHTSLLHYDLEFALSRCKVYNRCSCTCYDSHDNDQRMTIQIKLLNDIDYLWNYNTNTPMFIS